MLLLNAYSRFAMRRLALFALIFLSLVSAVFFLLQNRIAQQNERALLRQFQEIYPAAESSLLKTQQTLDLAHQRVILYTLRDAHHHDIAYFIQATTAKGYNGEITLLIGINPNHQLLGVRTVAHRETVGLGDKIDRRISPWIESFSGKSRQNTRFSLKKDGGDFDAFTGATITPRAVVNLVDSVLNDWETRNEP